MATLRELQQTFLHSILRSEDGEAILPHIASDKLDAQERLEIYRGNVMSNLTEALRAVYPVVDRLVGTEYFNYLAQAFIKQHPSTSGDIHQYGGEFSRFISDVPVLRSLPYLPDVATLEWSYHQAFHAADAQQLDISRLTAIPVERLDSIVFKLHPAVALISSEYPILKIWETNQPGYVGEDAVNLDDGGSNILVRRHDHLMELRSIAIAEYALLKSIALNYTFGDACNTALAIDPNLDLATLIQQLIEEIIIVDFEPPHTMDNTKDNNETR